MMVGIVSQSWDNSKAFLYRSIPMPNATVRANARPMPETPNRRAVLGALAAGAAASVVAVSTAAVAAESRAR